MDPRQLKEQSFIYGNTPIGPIFYLPQVADQNLPTAAEEIVQKRRDLKKPARRKATQGNKPIRKKNFIKSERQLRWLEKEFQKSQKWKRGDIRRIAKITSLRHT